MQPYNTGDLIPLLQELQTTPVTEMDEGHEINNDGYLLCCGSDEVREAVTEIEKVAADAIFRTDGKVNTQALRRLAVAGFNAQEQRDPEEPYMNYVQIKIPADEESGNDEDRTLTVSASLL